MSDSGEQRAGALAPYMTQAGAWAFALGTAIGWGSLVVTSNTYLLQAGPWGSVLGLTVGAAIMLVVGRNYHYLINCFPDSGGAYTYAKEVFGYDYGFMTSWFLSLTYIAILWANATSVPLFAHYFLGDVFRVGYLYTVFGYDVYLGEVALTICALVLAGVLCARSRRGTMRLMVVLAVLLSAGIAVCFAAAAFGCTPALPVVEPAFLPDESALSQVVLIACISPWAFIGFESISHSAEELAFPRKKVFGVLAFAVLTATVLYVFVLLLSTSAYPPAYDSWLAYISDLGNCRGLEALPPFYAAHRYLGDAGVCILMFVLFALITTSLIGNTVALSRLFRALGKDRILPERVSAVNGRHVPAVAIMIVVGFSALIPFLGRTAIGWIVDVTTIGATIVYGIVSASTFKVARARGDRRERVTGALGVVLMVAVGLYLLIPSLLMSQTLAAESYFLFAAWGILGFAFFRVLLGRDDKHRFGRSVVVWIGMLSLVLFVAFVWMGQSVVGEAESTMFQIHAHYFEDGPPTGERMEDHELIEELLMSMKDADMRVMIVAAGLFALAPVMLLTSVSHVSRWARRSEEELGATRSIVYTDPVTGLPSMTRFQELAREGAHAIAQAGARPAVAAIGLVGMEDFVGEHGHDAGERLQRDFADVLRAQFGEEACSRFADDRFYAFAPEDEVAGKLEAVFEEFGAMRAQESVESLPVSAGVYVCASGEDIVGVGIDRARSARDLDRKTWQSRITWFSDTMGIEAKLRLRVLDKVERAIAERWIRPYYQAVVCASANAVCGEEALARWVDPEHGLLSPAQFVPILEEAGLLHKVDMHMVACVLEDMGEKRARGVPVVPVSVNISLRDLGRFDIAGEVSRMADAAGVSHGLLHIEFTESAASEDPALFKAEVDALRAAGFEVWMDDFGSGYSSLNSLKDFDFDVVKLDMEFMRDERSEKTWDIVDGIIQMAHKIGVRALAEGVETDLQSDRLRDIGCDMLQGYYYAKPQPLAEVIRAHHAHEGLPRMAK